MTPKEALNKIWRDAYPKSCETWSSDKLCEHWRVVEKALNELEELKRDVARYFELLESNVSYVFLGTQDICDEFDELEDKLLKVGKENGTY